MAGLASLREQTLGGIAHPEWVDGKRLWLDPEVQEIVDKLHFGDPTLGWEGDPRLALYREGPRWLIQRLEHDGEYRIVCWSRPGLELDERLLMHLMAHDARRGANPMEKVNKANEAVQKAKDSASTERVHSAAEKLQWALRKDLG